MRATSLNVDHRSMAYPGSPWFSIILTCNGKPVAGRILSKQIVVLEYTSKKPQHFAVQGMLEINWGTGNFMLQSGNDSTLHRSYDCSAGCSQCDNDITKSKMFV